LELSGKGHGASLEWICVNGRRSAGTAAFQGAGGMTLRLEA
jgi:hypothetical protein